MKELCGSLDPHKGMGWDEVSPKRSSKRWLMRSRAPCPVCSIVASGAHYPTFFKVAWAVSVFTEFSNHRSISVLPVLSQMFKRVLQGRLLEFLDHQKVITPGQYGFRSGHSTAMAVLDMVERVREA
jgi:membrane-associated phospholipid phosphatase